MYFIAFDCHASPEVLVKDVFVGQEEIASHGDVGQGHPLPHEEGGVEQVGVEHAHHPGEVLPGPLRGGLVLLHQPQDGEDPGACRGQDLGVCEGDPLLDEGLLDGVLAAAELLGGEVVGDGVGLEEARAVGVLVGGDLEDGQEEDEIMRMRNCAFFIAGLDRDGLMT